jgi:hypothetical protein
MTITEALAEIKTIQKRIQKKREFVAQYLARHNSWRDPLEKSGGSVVAIREARQAIGDLHERVVELRLAINRANSLTEVSVGNEIRTISAWIVWKREVAPLYGAALNDTSKRIQQLRTKAQKEGVPIAKNESEAVGENDLIIHIDEQELATQIEAHEEIMGTLDGQLSLKNATTSIEV